MRVSLAMLKNNLPFKRSTLLPSFKVLHSFCSDSSDSHDDFKKVNKIQLTNENAQQVIKKLVQENDILLFMKGTPSNPMCGYSNYVVELLKKYGLTDYETVDILSDSVMRQQVKIFSSWPTYPQLYLKGEFVGGCDILAEMHKENELEELLTEKGLI